MKRKSAKSLKTSRKPLRTKKSAHPGKVVAVGWRIVYFIVAVLFLGALWVFIPNNKASQAEECANSISCISDLSGTYDDKNDGEFEGKKVQGPAIAGAPYLAELHEIQGSAVLGDTANKRIEVDLTNQKLYAFEGDKKVMEYSVSTGKPWTPTPTGDFRIWIKLRYTRMSGGSGAGYYNLPNVPYTMYLFNDKVAKHRGYGIHGAYWHNNFGHPMSHGCINMREEDVAKLYYWAHPVSTKNVNYPTADDPGTLVRIYGTTPSN